MKTFIRIFSLIVLAFIFSCNQNTGTKPVHGADHSYDDASVGGQENVQDNDSPNDVLKVAVGSNDHTTLVAALNQAGLVTSASNAGPFTVFASTNEAFNKLPKGTVEGLLKIDKKEDRQNILQYYEFMSALTPESFTDGQSLRRVNGDNVTVTLIEGKKC